MRDLHGKRALITGAARGIGRAISSALAREGATCLVSDMDEAAAIETAAEIASGGGTAHGYGLDVTDRESIIALRDRIHAERGPIDVLVNNAGVVFGGAFLDVPIEKHVTTYEVNTIGLMAMTHAVLPDLIAQPEGHIVHIASASGFVGLPYGSTYASSKWSVIGFSESLRLELAELGHRHVGMTAVCPSYVNTGLFEGAKPPLGTRFLTPERLAEHVVQAIRRNKPFVVIPPLVHIAPMLRGLVPLSVLDAIGRLFGMSTTMRDWRGHSKPPASRPAESEAVSVSK